MQEEALIMPSEDQERGTLMNADLTLMGGAPGESSSSSRKKQ
jgi:hypothetical protein